MYLAPSTYGISDSGVPGPEITQRRSRQRLGDDVELGIAGRDPRYRQANPVDGDAVAELQAVGERAEFDPQPPARTLWLGAVNLSDMSYDPGKHFLPGYHARRVFRKDAMKFLGGGTHQ